MIKLKNISKTFITKSNIVNAVKNVSLDIEKGEIFGIIGFSGAGKSTLIRCINLLEKPTSGEIWINDNNITNYNEQQLRVLRRKIGMIFQHFNLMRSRTVYDNIAFPLKKSNLSKKEKDEKILSLLELVDLKDKKNSYPSELSGGQKQRVAIARALANNPDVLLCDEATSALDPQTTKSILNLLKKVNEQLKITIILITHEMNVIKEICDKVAIMENGVIVESGKTIELFANPKKEMTKNFINTATNLSKIDELLKNKSDLFKIKDNGKILLLTYYGDNAGESLISTLSKTFKIDINILYGTIELLKENILGKLVISIHGEDLEKSIEYINNSGVYMEVIK